MPAERERERGENQEKEGEREKTSEQTWYTSSDLVVAADSRSVKRRDDDDGGGDPARHGRPRTERVGGGWQSRPSGGRDKDEQWRDPSGERRSGWSREAREEEGKQRRTDQRKPARSTDQDLDVKSSWVRYRDRVSI